MLCFVINNENNVHSLFDFFAYMLLREKAEKPNIKRRDSNRWETGLETLLWKAGWPVRPQHGKAENHAENGRCVYFVGRIKAGIERNKAKRS